MNASTMRGQSNEMVKMLSRKQIDNYCVRELKQRDEPTLKIAKLKTSTAMLVGIVKVSITIMVHMVVKHKIKKEQEYLIFVVLQISRCYKLCGATNLFFRKRISQLITYNSGGCTTPVDYNLVQRTDPKLVKNIGVIRN